MTYSSPISATVRSGTGPSISMVLREGGGQCVQKSTKLATMLCDPQFAISGVMIKLCTPNIAAGGQ